MSRKTPDPSVILGILLDRVLGVPAADTARKYSYQTKTISSLSQKYDLDGVERRLRLHIIGQAAELPAEAIELNQVYLGQLEKLSEEIFSQALPEDADKKCTRPDEEMKRLHTSVKALEEARKARLSIITMNESRKKAQPGQERESSYSDLMDEVDAEDD